MSSDRTAIHQRALSAIYDEQKRKATDAGLDHHLTWLINALGGLLNAINTKEERDLIDEESGK